MSRLVDPTICPDCRAHAGPVGHVHVVRPAGQGPPGAQLWDAMVDGRRVRRAAPPGVGAGNDPGTATAPAAAPASPDTATQAPGFTKPLYPRHPVGQADGPTQPRKGSSCRRPPCRWCCSPSGASACWSRRSSSSPSRGACSGLTGRTLVLLGFTGVLAAVAVAADPRGPARSRRDVLAGGGRHAHRRPPGRRVRRPRRPGCPVGARYRRTRRRRPAGHGHRRRRLGTRPARSASCTACRWSPSIGGLVLCSANAWAAENPAVADHDRRSPAGRRVRAAAPAGARGRRTAWAGWPASPGWCCSGWAGTARWRRSVSATGGPTSAGGRSWSLRCSPRSSCTSPESATRPGPSRPAPPSFRWCCWPTGRPRSARARGTCSRRAPPWWSSGWSPRSRRVPGHRGPPRSPGSGCSWRGILLVAGPWPALLALELWRVDGRGPGPGDAERRSLLDGRRGRAHAWSLPRRACCVTSPPRRAGTRPSWSARSRRQCSPSAASCWCSSSSPRCGRLSWPRVSRPRSPPVLPGGRATRPSLPSPAAAPRRTWPWSRCTPPSSDDLLIGPRHHRPVPGLGHGRGAPGAGVQQPRSPPRLAAALGALVGGWALVAWGLVMESDTEARALAAGGVRRPGRRPGRSR